MAAQKEKTMSFALYMIGFLIVIAGIAWGAMVAGVPQIYIMIGAVVLLGIGILSAVKRTRPKDPPPHVSSGRRADDV
jgi:NADH:ubiquinone oxidoreductase subunit 6 (subunit J)